MAKKSGRASTPAPEVEPEVELGPKRRAQTETAIKVINRILAAIKESGLPQTEVARRAGFTQPRFSRWWTGQGEPTVHHVVQVAAALGLPVSHFFGEEETPAPEVKGLDFDVSGRPDLVMLFRYIYDVSREVPAAAIQHLVTEAFRKAVSLPFEDAPKYGVITAQVPGPRRRGAQPGARLRGPKDKGQGK